MRVSPLFLMSTSSAAAGLYLSTLTRQPAIAAMTTFGLLLLLWIVDWAGGRGGQGGTVMSYLSLMGHLKAMLRGVFDTRDVVYYLLFTVVCLVLSTKRLDSMRLTG